MVARSVACVAETAIERLLRVLALSHGSFSPIATFLKPCSLQTCTGYTTCITLTDISIVVLNQGYVLSL